MKGTRHHTVLAVLAVLAASACTGRSSPGGGDLCPDDPGKTRPGICGCGVPDTDFDRDGAPTCLDACPLDPLKTAPGTCGCGASDGDADGDGAIDCRDGCPGDPAKTAPGPCNCGRADTDGDGDGFADCIDSCPADPAKFFPERCGCGEPETDSDRDVVPDCVDGCPSDPGRTEPGPCGCWGEDYAWLGVTTACNFAGCDARGGECGDMARALADCAGDLVLAKNLGVGWVRAAFPWNFLDPACDGGLDPARGAFLSAYLKAARDRGMKVLVQAGSDAPACAYGPPDTLDPPGGVTGRLDFKDGAFEEHLGRLLELARGSTCSFELLDEPNWLSPHFAQDPATGRYELPSYGAAGGHDYAARRAKELHAVFKRVLVEKAGGSFQPRALGPGVSYFYSSDFPGAGWTGYAAVDPERFIDPLVEAADWLSQMDGGWQPGGGSVLDDSIDVVTFHPSHFGPAELPLLAAELARAARGLSPGKELWATKAGWPEAPGDGAESARVFDAAAGLASGGTITRLFWHTVRDNVRWQAGDPDDPHLFAMYDYDGAPLKPALIAAVREKARLVPFDLRFDRPAAASATLYDFSAAAPTVSWYAGGYPPVGTLLLFNDSDPVNDAKGKAGWYDGDAEGGERCHGAIGVRLDRDHPVVQGDFLQVRVPATGIPTFRSGIALSETSSPDARVVFEVRIVETTGETSFAYARPYEGKSETVEVDLSSFMGRTVTIILLARETAPLSTYPDLALWIRPRLIDRET